MNNCTFIGRVGKDAVIRNTGNGKGLASWSIASEAGWGEKKVTTWIDCTLFGDRGEKLAPMILKGDRICVAGELSTREFEGKTYVTLNVREVTLLGEKRDAAPKAAQTRQETPRASGGAVGGFEDDSIPFSSRGKRNHWE